MQFHKLWLLLPDLEILFFPDLLCRMILWIWSMESFFTSTTGLGLFSKSCTKPSLSSLTFGWPHNWPSGGPLLSLSRLIWGGKKTEERSGKLTEMVQFESKISIKTNVNFFKKITLLWTEIQKVFLQKKEKKKSYEIIKCKQWIKLTDMR